MRPRLTSIRLYGGAIHVSVGTLTISRAQFTSNQAGGFGAGYLGGLLGAGGAIYVSGGTLTISRAQFTSNQAGEETSFAAFGGAIYANKKAFIQLLNVSFSGNKITRCDDQRCDDHPDGFYCNGKSLLSTTTTSATTLYTRTC